MYFRYEDMSTLGLPAEYKVSSVKYKKESLANPQITLFNYANFKGNKGTIDVHLYVQEILSNFDSITKIKEFKVFKVPLYIPLLALPI